MTLIDAPPAPRATRPGLAQRVADRASALFAKRSTTRRSFLVRTAIVGSALAVNPFRFLFKPGTAYAHVCGPANTCSGGWTVFCCSINAGRNSCPPNSITAGWWKIDNSVFCGGSARYILDCNALCSCGCGSSGICSQACTACSCHCGTNGCDQRRVCCNEFRYGQCHQEIGCVGAVVCRVVSCVPPWQWDPSCTAASATENRTAFHYAPCLDAADDASVYAFGAATYYGDPNVPLTSPVVGMDATPTGRGYWLVAADGGVFAYGDARFFGSTGGMRLDRPVTDLASTPSGNGYWLVANDGGIFAFGDARFRGSTGGMALRREIVGMANTPSGNGYWLVAADGGIFAFGDAQFFGSTGNLRLTREVVGMAATPTGNGYWLVAADGGIFAFGDAQFRGSTGNLRLDEPIVGMASTPTGNGYWLVAADGGIFTFGDARYYGGLPGTGRLQGTVVDAEATPAGDGYWVLSD
ncbi:MAG TPA: hypothetical protein VFZ83_12290 [Acidimicrobiia bacterium]|nr:hypothetical protein [Acidimicrobiia bacterium]